MVNPKMDLVINAGGRVALSDLHGLVRKVNKDLERIKHGLALIQLADGLDDTSAAQAEFLGLDVIQNGAAELATYIDVVQDTIKGELQARRQRYERESL